MPTGEKLLSEQATYYAAAFAKFLDARQASRATCEHFGINPDTLSRNIRFARERGITIGQPQVEPDICGSIDPSAFLRRVKSSGGTIEDLADFFSVPPKDIRATIEALRNDNRLVSVDSIGRVSIDKSIPTRQDFHLIDIAKHGETEVPFGFVADTHLVSKYERLDVLHALYDRFKGYGVQRVFHAGNWIDGEARFNKHDIKVHGVTGQVQYFVDAYPQREGIVTDILSGDDHEGWYVQDGFNVGDYMQKMAEAKGRYDLRDLGYMERDIALVQDEGSANLRIIHAGGGSAYAISYTSQKYVESLQGGEKPTIIIVGHFHKFDYSYPREVHVIQPGCTCDQTPFMRKRRIQAMVGGCVGWVKQASNGVILSLKLEWIPFYDKKFYAYQW